MALDSRRNMTTPTRRGGVVPSTSNGTKKQAFPSPNMAHERIIRRQEPSLGQRPKSGKNTLSRAPLPDKPAGALNPNPTSARGYAPAGVSMPTGTSRAAVNRGTTPTPNKSSLERAARRKLGM